MARAYKLFRPRFCQCAGIATGVPIVRMHSVTLCLGAIAACVTLAAPAFGTGPSLVMLDQLDGGRWEVRERAASQPQRLCVPNGRRLIQLRHPGAHCETFVVEDGPAQVEVQYTCQGRGYGRTRVRRETNRLVQIDSQGIADGLPFEFSVEARRVGDCAGG